MPPMRRKYLKELKTAFDMDFEDAKKNKKSLVSEGPSPVHMEAQMKIVREHRVRRALQYRVQIEKHIQQLVEEGASPELIEVHIGKARQMFREVFLGLK